MTAWTLVYKGFDPAAEGLREALCTLGNGYIATRGAAPESGADGVHYPGTYAAGCFDLLDSAVGGRTVSNEDIVNLPNWLPLSFAAPGCAWFRPEEAQLLDYRQELDLRHGVLHRRFRFRDEHGRVTAVRQRRLVSMADPHLAALETVFIAENWSGPLRVRSALDGRVTNRGVRRYHDLNGAHLTGHVTGAHDGITWLSVRTRTSEITVALAARVETSSARRRVGGGTGWIAERHVLDLRQGRPATFTKIVALVTSRDRAIADAPSAAIRAVRRAPGFGELLDRHRTAWDGLWRRARLDVNGPQVGRVVHLHVFHLLQTLSPHTADLDAGVPARGLHGEAYRGHVFWDELFVLPWLTMRFPEISRGLLRYRWRRLPEARAAAREAGFAGAMFPWQSGSDGTEQTQTLHLNPISGHWLPDHSHLQRHVGLAIAYNTWQYHSVTGDIEFLVECGAELLVEIARFFASLAVPDPVSGRYEIHGVMGPDEYHESYPGAASPGLDNSAYTNVMTVWLLLRARQALALLPEHERQALASRLALTDRELERWDDITRRMRIDFHDGVISQFTGYADLLELDWERYRGVRRLDRALEAGGDSPNRYRASKQADVLMLFYLLTADELGEILDRLGYRTEPDLIPRTVGHYLARTCHGSTLSAVVHAWVLARSDRARSWRFFTEALSCDIDDVQGGTTAEGVHLGAMAGTLDLVQRCYLGLEAGPDGVRLSPLLPARLTTLALPIRVRGAWLSIDVEPGGVRVTRGDDGPEHLNVTVYGQAADLERGAVRVFGYPGQAVAMSRRSNTGRAAARSTTGTMTIQT
ncbi:glycoside hydrolase family 65 protein [Planobispora siamensis]|uniref:Family 65 glycosyl hydrolase n=1 Tax=Planobispora siamensis TaxID=936338 RepID=A0A8J3WPJ8_9ACTN|nr:glycoside hydrolase family 65 protein [Planobispora siamensis]GIH95777.1 family 65 glycosyl hydrolase [Planobispora siamensis]